MVLVRIGTYQVSSVVFGAEGQRNYSPQKCHDRSSSSCHDRKAGNDSPLVITNPQPTREYLELTDTQVCLGWMFIGSCDKANWKQGRRRELKEGGRLTWK
mmetsp:Transcript_25178/g.62067  ORF Transcript_25178/g.62067 Transcript_25178/m.62067 type:complete len:100 (-) Transcript_25178:805-1104(-)